MVGRELSQSWIEHSCSILSSQRFERKHQWVALEPASKQKKQGMRKLEREREGVGKKGGKLKGGSKNKGRREGRKGSELEQTQENRREGKGQSQRK